MTGILMKIGTPVLILAVLAGAAFYAIVPPPPLPALPVAAEFEELDRAFVAMAADGRHSDWEHNPNRVGAPARQNIAALLVGWAQLLSGGPDGPRVECGAVQDGSGAIVRWAIWVLDPGRATGGYVSVFSPGNQNPWVSSYDTTREIFRRGPNSGNLKKTGRGWATGLGCPGELPALQHASAPALAH